MKKYIGCDLGGINLRAAIVDDETGKVLPAMTTKLQRKFTNVPDFLLGIAAANVCVAIGPRRIIMGGGVAQAGNNAGVIGVACWAASHS